MILASVGNWLGVAIH